MNSRAGFATGQEAAGRMGEDKIPGFIIRVARWVFIGLNISGPNGALRVNLGICPKSVVF